MRRLALLLTLVAPVVASAQPQVGASQLAGPPTARLYVPRDTVEAGQRLRIAVAVDHAPGVQALFPAVPPVSPEAAPLLVFGDVEALAARREMPRVRGSVRTDSAVYTVAVFAIDHARVGPVAVRLAQDGDTTIVTTGVAVVPVRSLLDGDLADAEPDPLGPPDPFPSPVPALVALGVFALLLVGGIVWAWRRRRRPVISGTPRPAAYPEALARLDTLDGAAPATPDDVEAHVDALKEVLRTYVARRLGLPAARTTTDELTDRMATVAWLSDDARRAVRGVLRLADLVDFAALRPPAEAAADARARTREAVEAVEAAARARETAAAPPAP